MYAHGVGLWVVVHNHRLVGRNRVILAKSWQTVSHALLAQTARMFVVRLLMTGRSLYQRGSAFFTRERPRYHKSQKLENEKQTPRAVYALFTHEKPSSVLSMLLIDSISQDAP